MLKRIVILGSTGSIGTQTLEVVRLYPDLFEIVGLAAFGSKKDLLYSQIKEFNPKYVALFDESSGKQCQLDFPNKTVFYGTASLKDIVSVSEADYIMAAASGIESLEAILYSLKSNKTVALANKEVLVSGGSLVKEVLDLGLGKLIPVDSEHSAIYQCLEGRNHNSVRKIILTASGGPFLNRSLDSLKDVTVEDVLQHPIWNMGAKVTVDSSTMINKGLEIIEAYWLFNCSLEQLDTVIHPQSMIHGMVEFNDGSTISLMNPPSMLFPIQYSLTLPERYPVKHRYIDWSSPWGLDFKPVDKNKYRGFFLAKAAMSQGTGTTCFFNAANDVLVQKFLSREISWLDISNKLDSLLDQFSSVTCTSLDDVKCIDKEARLRAQKI